MQTGAAEPSVFGQTGHHPRCALIHQHPNISTTTAIACVFTRQAIIRFPSREFSTPPRENPIRPTPRDPSTAIIEAAMSR